LRIFALAAHLEGMKAYLSLVLTGALSIGASLLVPNAALGASRKSENSSSHRSRSSSHRHSSSHHSGNSGSKTHSNVPSK